MGSSPTIRMKNGSEQKNEILLRAVFARSEKRVSAEKKSAETLFYVRRRAHINKQSPRIHGGSAHILRPIGPS